MRHARTQHARSEPLPELVRRAAAGDLDATACLVTRFQDLAFATAYTRLRDAGLAEDAAQEAFIDAHQHLGQLREPAAFASWFRRVVLKHCDRVQRRKRVGTMGFDRTRDVAEPGTDPAAAVAMDEVQQRVRRAVDRLPEPERLVILTTYLAEQTANEASEYLELPLTTVKKRLHTARRRLAANLVDVVADSLASARPSRDHRFSARVQLFIALARGRVEDVTRLLDTNPELLDAQEDWALDEAASGRLPDAIRATPLTRAAEQGDLALIELLLARGADPGRACGCLLRETPLFAAAVTGRADVVARLLAAGADPEAQTFVGQRALHAASMRGYIPVVQLLLAHGADPEARDRDGRTACDWARANGHDEVVALLTTGAAPALREPSPGTPGDDLDFLCGRVLAADGTAIDDGPDLGRPLPCARGSHAHGRWRETVVWETGIKAVDLFAPLGRAGAAQVEGRRARNLGQLILLCELLHRAGADRPGRGVWVGWERVGYERRNTLTALSETRAIETSTLIYADAGASPAWQRRAAATAMSLARSLDERGEPVVLIGLEPVDEWGLVTAARGLTVLIADSPECPAGAPVPAYLDARIVLDPHLAALQLFPAVDSAASTSRLAVAELVGERHCRVAAAARMLLGELRRYDRRWNPDAPELDPDRRDRVARAWRLQAYLTQPFFSTEPFSGRAGSFVPRERLLDEVEAILDGVMDDVPLDELFYRSDHGAGSRPVGPA